MNAVFVSSFGQIEQLATAGRYLSIDRSNVADRDRFICIEYCLSNESIYI